MHDATWNELLDAHHRAKRPTRTAIPTHRPKAAILACSDARVPPSVIFDQPAGALFVVRIAGNTASPTALASLDYAVAELGIELLIVLGHTGCGAVQAAAAGTCAGHLAPIVEPIFETAMRTPEASVDEIVRRNVDTTVEALILHTGPTGIAARTGQLEVRGAVYDLLSGHLESLPAQSLHPQSISTPAI